MPFFTRIPLIIFRLKLPFFILFTASYFLFSMSVVAQDQPNELSVTGRIIDADTQTPLPYATISLFNPGDSALITGAITDEQGLFTMEAQPGRYYADINFVGYASRRVPDVELAAGQETLALGDIVVQAEATGLEEVIVQGERNQVQLALDKKIFNVSQDPINAGRTASEILGNLPSVAVDNEGNVSLRGSSNVQILIDGKPSGLLSFDGAEGLRQLQGDLVENVEIITNPSARYQAEGMSGIINIVLKKERRKGVNGSFDFTAGYPHNYGTAINMNYRREKLNFFINYGIFYRNITNPNNRLYQEVYEEGNTFITQQHNINRQKGFSNNIQLGADYFFDENNILTTSFTYRHKKGQRNSEIEYLDYLNTTNNLSSITRRYQDEKETEPNLEYALNYKRAFQRKGQELTAMLTYLDNWEDSDQEYREFLFTPNNTPDGAPQLQHSDNYETEKQLLLQADYIHPFGKEGKMEAGIRGTWRDITNDFLVSELVEQEFQPLPGLDNNFAYDENIYAAYLITSNKVKQFGYQLGLRAEYSDVTTELLENNVESNHRDYLNLFPTAHFTYDLSGNNSLQISYSRRLHRPTYNDLSPFVTFVDKRNYFSGNPDLNPEYTHSIEMGHIKYFEKGSVNSTVYYRHTIDKIVRLKEFDSLRNSTLQPYNLSSEDAFGIEFISSYQPFAWWNLDLNMNFFHAEIDGANLDENYQSQTYTWFSRLTSRFTLWGDTDLQLRGNYDAPQNTPQGKRYAVAYMSMAITRDILKRKGTLTLNISDVFNTNRNRAITEGDNFYVRSSFQERPRINLALNYRLNQRKGESKNKLEESAF